MSQTNVVSVLLEILGDKEVVAFRPAIGRALGSPMAALFLSQAIFWQKVVGPGGWFFKLRDAEREGGKMVPPSSAGRQSWEWELGGMGRSEQEAARKILVARGLLEEKRKGIPAKLHFRVNLEKLATFLLENQQMADSGQQDGGEPPPSRQDTADKPAGSQPTISEIIPENTSKINPKIEAAGADAHAAAPAGKIYNRRPSGIITWLPSDVQAAEAIEREHSQEEISAAIAGLGGKEAVPGRVSRKIVQLLRDRAVAERLAADDAMLLTRAQHEIDPTAQARGEKLLPPLLRERAAAKPCKQQEAA